MEWKFKGGSDTSLQKCNGLWRGGTTWNKKKKRGKVLNQNINSGKYDYDTRMEIKKIKICFPKRPYSLHFGLQMIKLEEEKRG